MIGAMTKNELEHFNDALIKVFASGPARKVFRAQLAAHVLAGVPKFMHRPDRVKIALEDVDLILKEVGL